MIDYFQVTFDHLSEKFFRALKMDSSFKSNFQAKLSLSKTFIVMITGLPISVFLSSIVTQPV